MGQAVNLSPEHLELLSRHSQCSGQGGHQIFFGSLRAQRKGNRQSISGAQLKMARERLDSLDEEGTWQDAYAAILSYFPDTKTHTPLNGHPSDATL